MLALAIGALALAGIAVPAAIALAFLNRKDNRELVAAANLLDAERRLAAQYKHERDASVAARDIAEAVAKQERELRTTAEAQRDRARERAYELLRTHLKDATDDEIRAATADAFAGFDGVPPAVPARSDTGPDALVDPFADVPPA